MSDAKSFPPLNQSAVNQIFTSLADMEVQLDSNPLDYGPRRLNNKIAEARRFSAAAERMFQDSSHWYQQYKAAHRTAETLLDLDVKNLMANDPETRAARNVQTSTAIAHMKLRPQVEELGRLQGILDDIMALQAVIKSKRSDLKDTQARIRDQIRLCHEEIGLGARWGSKPPPGTVVPDLPETKGDVTTLSQLTDIFEGVQTGGGPLAAPEEADVPPPYVELSLVEDLPAEPEADASELLGATNSDSASDEFLAALDSPLGKSAPGKPSEGLVAREPIDIDAILQDFNL